MAKKRPKKAQDAPATEIYEHKDATVALRPDVGTQAQFKKQKPSERFRYDSSLSPALDWDGQNSAREKGEALIAEILVLTDKLRSAQSDKDRESLTAALQETARRLQALGKPFLNWAGKAERLSFDVPTLPLFVHERLSTEAIIRTLRGHRKSSDVQTTFFDLFADPHHSIADQVLKAYEYRDQWTNRMILGDSLVVMNSLLHFENLGGQVQMIYMDPPYGIKYGSNFQPFVRRRDVKHNDDDDLTREPEMVQAYRDTWEIGLHSYLTCMRDRLLLCRELLHPSGSVFVQIGDENVHHIREVMDETFGAENFISLISVKKTATPRKLIDSSFFYVVWYAKNVDTVKYRPLFIDKPCDEWARDTPGGSWGVEIEGKRRALLPSEKRNTNLLPPGAQVYCLSKLTSVMDIPATYVQATPDLLMGDLLKNMRSSQIFSVCGLPEIDLRKLKKNGDKQYEVELLGLDVFDPTTMETQHRRGDDVPAWFLDTDFNDLCFHVCQAFFPRTSAWDSLKKALRGDYAESVWDHLSGTVSAPFEAGEHGQIAVKVIDDRGNELVVVKKLSEVG